MEPDAANSNQKKKFWKASSQNWGNAEPAFISLLTWVYAKEKDAGYVN